MQRNIAIIGSGPTAIYAATHLLAQTEPVYITIYESQNEVGKGTPYHPKWNSESMLANIASIEIPPVNETLEAWLKRQTDERLARMGIERKEINERAFFPRVALGEYFHAQLNALVEKVIIMGHTLTLRPCNHVVDVQCFESGIAVISRNEGGIEQRIFTHVIMATGHNLPMKTEIRPGYFISPWPAMCLRTIGQCHVGIRGTSLSAIDAVVALAVARGMFYEDASGVIHYLSEPGTEAFHITMMSRKGLLPEADFYHTIPYEALRICTADAVDALIETPPPGELLENVFLLFKAELTVCDPAYAESIGLCELSLEAFCETYFSQRERYDAFKWARLNLAEAQANLKNHITVAWRYAILRMHEVVARIVRHLPGADLKRFHQHFKHIFVDDYATVPHLSIQRLLALHNAGKLSIQRLGKNYHLDIRPAEGGAILYNDGHFVHFPAFIEATGQRCLSAEEFPFPSLWEQGIIKNATAPGEEEDIGGIALDKFYHPLSDSPQAPYLYCLSLPFMLSQFPFAQGISSSHDMGKVVAQDIMAKDINSLAVAIQLAVDREVATT